MEKHVTSLELSKKLKELGVPQKSNFAYWTGNKNKLSIIQNGVISSLKSGDFAVLTKRQEYISAFLASEVLEMLPVNTIRYFWIKNAQDGSKYYELLTDYEKITDTKEADLLAKMLIYLIENGLLDVKSLLK